MTALAIVLLLIVLAAVLVADIWRELKDDWDQVCGNQLPPTTEKP